MAICSSYLYDAMETFYVTIKTIDTDKTIVYNF